MQIQHALKLSLLCLSAWAVLPRLASAQERQEESDLERQARLARRGAGIRAGAWLVDIDPAANASRSPAFEGYFQRGLDKHLALESSASVWWITTAREQTLPLGGSETVETKAYVVPLLTSLKFFPMTDVSDQVEPFVMAGVGFVLGIEDEPDNAIGSSGTSLVTGFGFRGGGGIELHMTHAFGIAAGVKYQWIRLGENIGGRDTFNGLGVEGGITYRFQF